MGAAGAKSPGAQREIGEGVYMKIGGDMVASTYAYWKVSRDIVAAVFGRRKGALSLGFKCSVWPAMMLSRCGTR